MIKCLILDDEPLALDLIEDNLKHVPYIQVVARCRNVAQALPYLQSGEIDLLFSDIQMPGSTGMDLVRSLPVKPMVIFITAYEHFALDSFDLEILDYMLKPVPLERFLKACHRAYQQFELQKLKATPVFLPRKHIFVHSDYNLIRISLDEIEYVEGLKDYVKISVQGRERPILSRMSIKSLEQQLPDSQFYRVHKSYIVNIDYVVQIRRGKIKTGTAELPLSDSYRDIIHKMTGLQVA